MRVEFGTLEVEQYVRRWREPGFSIYAPSISQGISTWGPKGLYQGVLVVEKDGLLEFIRRAGIAERYDLMVAASEGQGTEAIRSLIASFSVKQVPVYLLHDYDLAGVQIAAALSGRDTKSWEWDFQPLVHDLGIDFADIEPWDIQDESVSDEDDFVPLLRELGCSEEEIDYLVAEQWQAPSERKNRRGQTATFWSGRRAELNGLIGQDFIDYIEAKLDALEIEKLLPTDEWLRAAYSHILNVNALNGEIEQLVSDWKAEEREAPADLRERLSEKLRRDREMPWDLALAELLEEDDEEEA
jgi:Topoisomerase 6 subunit A/Spo11, Toprim domain